MTVAITLDAKDFSPASDRDLPAREVTPHDPLVARRHAARLVIAVVLNSEGPRRHVPDAPTELSQLVHSVG
jgi:hypothetical protein